MGGVASKAQAGTGVCGHVKGCVVHHAAMTWLQAALACELVRICIQKEGLGLGCACLTVWLAAGAVPDRDSPRGYAGL